MRQTWDGLSPLGTKLELSLGLRVFFSETFQCEGALLGPEVWDRLQVSSVDRGLRQVGPARKLGKIQ